MSSIVCVLCVFLTFFLQEKKTVDSCIRVFSDGSRFLPSDAATTILSLQSTVRRIQEDESNMYLDYYRPVQTEA